MVRPYLGPVKARQTYPVPPAPSREINSYGGAAYRWKGSRDHSSNFVPGSMPLYSPRRIHGNSPDSSDDSRVGPVRSCDEQRRAPCVWSREELYSNQSIGDAMALRKFGFGAHSLR